MRFNMYRKLLILLSVVILVSLSSSILLRNFIIRDFKAFGEGRMIDRLYQIQAVLEGRYEQTGKWQKQQLATDFVWAWLSGIELKLFDTGNNLVLDTEQALASLTPVMQQRTTASTVRRPPPDTSVEFQSYPLYLDGMEIGHLDVRLPRPVHEALFIRSSNIFLASAMAGLGMAAIILSFFAARKITGPMQQLTAAARAMADGTLLQRVAIESDDEIGQLAAAFNRMSDSLEAQERLRKQLVSNAAHELRTPLMVIRGELEGMIDRILPTTPEALQSLHDETVRLSAILDGVDELTRAQAAVLNLNRQPVRLVCFLQEVVSRFARQADEQRVLLTVKGDEQLEVMIDPDQFTRIIINLVSNALKVMHDGGALTVSVTDTGDACTRIEVTDTGCGIEADILPHIFERFYKGRNGGLGLGLAIVKELADAHNGTISVTSSPGCGTCFTIELPDIPKGDSV